MSSHHVVKERQEPALIIHDLVHLDDDLLDQLLEWTPTIITNDDCALQLIAKGIKIDVLVSGTDLRLPQSHVSHIPAIQKSFLELSLNYLVSKEYPAVNIIGETIPTHALALYWDKINIVILQREKKIFPVKSGFNKWKPAKDLILIYGNKDTFTTKGLQNIEGQLYATVTDGFYEISFADKPFMLIAELF